MIKIERTMRADALRTVELLGQLLFAGESCAHEFIIAPAEGLSFEGCGVVARFAPADGQTLEILGSLDEDGSADVILPAACYAAAGAFRLTIYVTRTENAGEENEKTTTVCVYACAGSVIETSGTTDGETVQAEPVVLAGSLTLGLDTADEVTITAAQLRALLALLEQ